jgi:hypothetical protein
MLGKVAPHTAITSAEFSQTVERCSRMIFIRWPPSTFNIPIAVFSSLKGIMWLTSGSSLTIPL